MNAGRLLLAATLTAMLVTVAGSAVAQQAAEESLEARSAEAFSEVDRPPLKPMPARHAVGFSRLPQRIRDYNRPLAEEGLTRYRLRLVDSWCDDPNGGGEDLPAEYRATVAVDFAPLAKGVAVLTFKIELRPATGDFAAGQTFTRAELGGLIPVATQLDDQGQPLHSNAGARIGASDALVALELRQDCEAVLVTLNRPNHSPIPAAWTIDGQPADDAPLRRCIVAIDRTALVAQQAAKRRAEQAAAAAERAAQND